MPSRVPAAIAKRARRFRQLVEPWYLAYGLVGAATGGVAPIVLPLVVDDAGDPSHVGLVVAAIGLGGLSAAYWGNLADRRRWHRVVFTGSALAGALALAAFAATTSVPMWIVLALVVGIAQSATNTVANLFIVEAHPQAEWTVRIGWLQTFYNAGIVGGLAVAGGVSQWPLAVGLLAGSASLLLAGVYGGLTTRTPPQVGALSADVGAEPAGGGRRVLRAHPLHALHVEWTLLSPLRLVHAPHGALLAHARRTLRTPFGLFLAVWLVANVGGYALFALYPLVMQQVFDISPGPSSFALAAATGIGLALYSPASMLSARFGPTLVFRAALGARLMALVGLVGAAERAFAGREVVVVLAFTIVALCFPLLSVSTTVLTSRLAPSGEGESMGLYTAATALAGLLGAVLGGWAAAGFGYAAPLVLAAVSVLAGLLLSAPLRLTPPS